MGKSALNNPRTIVCIHCQYERAINDGLDYCPECGMNGLVLRRHLAPRLKWLRSWVWGEILMGIAIVACGVAIQLPGPVQLLGVFLPLLLLIATIQGFIGIFISGACMDRRGLHENQSIHKYTWIGMPLSILLFCSIAIVILL